MTTTKPECSNCTNCENKQACVPFFQHENSMMHKDRDNRRMMVICLALCAVDFADDRPLCFCFWSPHSPGNR